MNRTFSNIAWTLTAILMAASILVQQHTLKEIKEWQAERTATVVSEYVLPPIPGPVGNTEFGGNTSGIDSEEDIAYLERLRILPGPPVMSYQAPESGNDLPSGVSLRRSEDEMSFGGPTQPQTRPLFVPELSFGGKFGQCHWLNGRVTDVVTEKQFEACR